MEATAAEATVVGEDMDAGSEKPTRRPPLLLLPRRRRRRQQECQQRLSSLNQSSASERMRERGKEINVQAMSPDQEKQQTDK